MTADVAQVCSCCFRACALAPGATGACRARANVGGRIVPAGYGRVTSLAIDPIEKKPIARWMGGTSVLSAGGYGCNLRCPWCQNAEISQVGEDEVGWREIAPEELVALAIQAHERDPRMLGVAYTYNEPLVCWEYVRDCTELVRRAGLRNVLVSAGCVSPHVVEGLAPLIDAANIDLKCFSEDGYRMLGGSFEQAKSTIEILASEKACHLEVTTLVVPGFNDSEDEIARIAAWLASVDPAIVLHVTRYHPAWRMRDVPATPAAQVRRLADVAHTQLEQVLTGNI